MGKVRESGMPEEEYWGSFFDPVCILAALACPRAGDIIEFGCGYGHFTLPAAKLTTGTVYSLDIDPAMIERTAIRGHDEGLTNLVTLERDFVADGCGRPEQSAAYVMLFNILHIENPVALFHEAWRVLAPGGRVGVIHWHVDARDFPRPFDGRYAAPGTMLPLGGRGRPAIRAVRRASVLRVALGTARRAADRVKVQYPLVRPGDLKYPATMLRLCRILALVATVGIVLPPAWCCAIVRSARVAAATAPAKADCCKRASRQCACCPRGCCQRRQTEQRSDSGRMPACPICQLCTERSSALPVKRAPQPHTPVLAAPAVVCEVAITCAPTGGWKPSLSPYPERPPTHLLQCVWRC